jgi:lysophospholipase
LTAPASEADEGTFGGAGGRQIFWRSWLGAEPLRAIVVLAHGFGEHSGRYEHVAERLKSEGYGVYALDHHGHGRSAGARGRFAMNDAIDDLDQLVLLAASRHPDADVFLLGHSLGGAIALRYAMRHSNRLAGLIVSAPVAEVDGRRAAKAAGRLLGRLVPALPVARVNPKLISRDPAVVAAYEFDPLVFWGIPAGTAAELLAHADALPDDVRSVTLPTLLIWGTDDRICAPAGAEMVARRIGSNDLTTTPYPGLYHEILNEPEREQVLGELLEWLAARVPAAQVSSRLGE